jgi:hypothetical protein
VFYHRLGDPCPQPYQVDSLNCACVQVDFAGEHHLLGTLRAVDATRPFHGKRSDVHILVHCTRHHSDW